MNSKNKYIDMQKIRAMLLPNVGFIRILHAVPDAPSIDAYTYDRLMVRDLPYGEYADYFPLVVEPHGISIYPTGTKETPVLEQTINIAQDAASTLAIIGRLNNIEFLEIPTANRPTDNNTSMVRFAHLSPNAPAVDITLPDGTILFGNVSFKQVTPSIPVDPSNGTIQVRVAGTPTVALTVPNVELDPNKSYTVYATGLVGAMPELSAMIIEEPPLEQLILLEGENSVSS